MNLNHLNIAGKHARKNTRVENLKNPHLLYQQDLNAWAVVNDYRQALEFGAKTHIEKLREANPDYLPYFNWCDRDYIKRHGQRTEKVDQLEATV